MVTGTNNNFAVSDCTVRALPKVEVPRIKRFYDVNQYKWSMMGCDNIYVVEYQKQIVASVIVSSLTEGDFLHALVVANDLQRKGLARILMSHCKLQHPSLICFAEQHLSSLYEKCGFSQAHISSIDVSLQNRYEVYLKKQKCLKVFTYLKK